MKRKLILLFFVLPSFFNSSQAQKNAPVKWKEIYKVANAMKEPSFSEKIYKITDYGAVPDGETMNTTPINNAIRDCNSKGGGTVLVSEGKFLTGPVHLLSNVNLKIDESATLVFSTDPKDYLPLVQTRWEGNDCYNYSPLIYANGQTNFAVTGKGKIDGQGSKINWWPWKGHPAYGWQKDTPSQLNEGGRPLLDKWEKEQVPADKRQMGEGHYLRPQLINFIHCKNVLIKDVTLLNSPFWVIHPLLSENVIVRGVSINSLGPNSDGCDPESCKNVLIENCTFQYGRRLHCAQIRKKLGRKKSR